MAALHGGELRPHTGPVNLVIQPGFRFAVVQGLLTNFHLPRSSLLLLVSALLGRRRLLALYAEAIERDYRFFPMAMPCGSRLRRCCLKRFRRELHEKSPRSGGGWPWALMGRAGSRGAQAAARLAATKSQFTSFSR